MILAVALAMASSAMAANTPPVEPASFFAVEWARAYDQAAQAHGSSIRIVDPVSCAHDGATRFVCKITLHDRQSGAITCATATVGIDGTVSKVAPRACITETAL